MKINKRLQQIASCVPNNSYIMDVGCDHALLGIFLILEKENIKVLATDVHEKPLLQAWENITKYGVENQITLRLGDGLSVLEEGVDTIIISGMGGETISQICKEQKEKLANIKSIILSPNNEFKRVRKTLVKLGFCICEEIMVKEKNKFYPIIKFTKGKTQYSEIEYQYGPLLLKNKTPNFLEYCYEQIEKWQKIKENIPKDEYEKVTLEINKLNEIIKDEC